MREEMYISVFKGSVVEADQVHDYLIQNNIGSLVKNHMQENLSAGWIGVEAESAAEVFVSEEDRIPAEKLVLNMFHTGLAAGPVVVAAETGKGETANENPKI